MKLKVGLAQVTPLQQFPQGNKKNKLTRVFVNVIVCKQ